jgi:hypothetical protein
MGFSLSVVEMQVLVFLRLWCVSRQLSSDNLDRGDQTGHLLFTFDEDT